MDNQIDRLRKMLELWLDKNDLNGDLRIYTPKEWQARNEKYCKSAELVITTEGQLYSLITYNSDNELYEEFEELLESFNYYYEKGEHWYFGLYKIDETQRQNIKSTYSEKLKDERWIKKRNLVRQRAENKCEDCGESSNGLEIHHCYYLYGYEPWEYPTGSLRCLCKACHKSRDPIEKKLRGQLAHLKQNELETLNEFLSKATYWFPQKDVFEFIKTIGYDTKATKNALDNLLSKQRDSHD
ncbi:MAG: hypothetical protein J0L69_07635 [Bacteroidetes bacterium]|nr:hypothetical protein [Bacteroidota bacterium]